MNPCLPPEESLERRERGVRIERAILREGFTLETLAAHLAITIPTLRRIVNGASAATLARRRVTNILKEEFWPGVKVEPPSAELIVIEAAISKAVELVGTVTLGSDAETNPKNSAIADELNAVASPEVRAAIVALGRRLPFGTLRQIITVFPQPLLDRLLGISRLPDGIWRGKNGTSKPRPLKRVPIVRQ